MGDTDKCNNSDMIHRRLQSSFGTSIIPNINPNFMIIPSTTNTMPFTETSKRSGGVPPTSPYSQIPSTSRPQPSQNQNNYNQGASHSRSMSQPSSFFSFDSLPPLSPSPFRDHDVSMEDRGDSLRTFNHSSSSSSSSSLLPPSPFTRCNSSSRAVPPPRKSHRRSNSDIIPTCFNSIPPPPSRPLERSSISGGGSANPFVKKEGVGVGEAMDDLFSAYMNLENIDSLNSSSENNMESSRASGTKTNNGGSDTEGESSSVNETSADHNNNLKRRAAGGDVDIAPTTRHYRSVSVDSCFIDKLSFGEDSHSLKPPPSPGRKLSPTNSVDAAAAFSLEFKTGEFTAAEMKKIMANDKLAEMAVSDPKRVKRILANRQSAARSKERKMRYIVELEHKVQTLQTEATTLSAQLTLLQRDMMGLTNQNNELKFRLQSMEQQARLRDALNEALNGEVQRLKLAIGESSSSSSHNNEADRSKMQSLNAEMFQQLNINQLRQPQSQSQQNGTISTKPQSNE